MHVVISVIPTYHSRYFVNVNNDILNVILDIFSNVENNIENLMKLWNILCLVLTYFVRVACSFLGIHVLTNLICVDGVQV